MKSSHDANPIQWLNRNPKNAEIPGWNLAPKPAPQGENRQSETTGPCLMLEFHAQLGSLEDQLEQQSRLLTTSYQVMEEFDAIILKETETKRSPAKNTWNLKVRWTKPFLGWLRVQMLNLL